MLASATSDFVAGCRAVLRLGAAVCLATGLVLAGAFASLANAPPAIRWAVSGAGPGTDDADGIGVDPLGRTSISGGFDGTASFGPAGSLTSAGSADIFAAGYGPSGRIRWARRFGGPGPDQAFDSDADSNGNALITGSFNRSVDFGGTILNSRGGLLPRYGDAFVLKLDSHGRTRWVRQIGGPRSDGGDEIATGPGDQAFVIGDANGDVEFTPTTILRASGGRDSWAARYRRNGSLVFARLLGGPGEQQAHGISADPESRTLVTGEFQGESQFGTKSLVSDGPREDIYLAKLGRRGSVIWAKRFGDADFEIGRGVDADAQGNVYFTGEFAGTVQLGRFTLTSAGGNDSFVAKADPNGNVLWATRMGGPGTESGPEIEVAPDGTTYVSGRFSETAQFGRRTLTTTGARGAFVAKVSPAGRFIWAVQSKDSPFATLGELSLGPGSVNVLGSYLSRVKLGRFTLSGLGGSDFFVAELRR
jgi:hypothetical protein